MKVFWSWQDDSPGKVNRHFIKGALQEALTAIEGDYQSEDAERPELDHDTKGVPGATEIVPTLMKKIAGSVVFVADVTPIGISSKGKALPNPNVMVELGWSLNKPGDGRQIYILNTAEGWTIEQLPFDIRHRRILTYCLSESADSKMRDRAKKRLVSDLTDALKVNLDAHLEEQAQVTPAVGTPAILGDPSIWEGGDRGFRYLEPMSAQRWKEVVIRPGPRSYLRVIPAGWKKEPPAAAEMGELHNDATPWPVVASSEGSFGVTKEGYVWFWIVQRADKIVEAENVTMYFDDGGEFWTIHGSAVHESARGDRWLQLRPVISGWADALRRINWILDHFGALPVRRVEAGLVRVEDVLFPGDRMAVSPPARRSSMMVEKTLRDWSDLAVQQEFLIGALEKIYALHGLPAPSYDEKRAFINSINNGKVLESPYK